MNCEMAWELMLEADLRDLSPTSVSELGQHLRDCPACRARAERIVADSRALAAVVGAMRPTVDISEVRIRAAAAARSIQDKRRVWRRASLVTPLALAAGIGALLLIGDENGGSVPPTPRSAAPATEAALDVETPAGTNVAVFRSDNPQIVVIWYF